jgi:hypothetical protein
MKFCQNFGKNLHLAILFRHFVLAKFRYGEIFLFWGNSSSKPVLDNGGGMEKPGSLNHLRPLYLERLHELA